MCDLVDKMANAFFFLSVCEYWKEKEEEENGSISFHLVYHHHRLTIGCLLRLWGGGEKKLLGEFGVGLWNEPARSPAATK